MPAKKTTRQQCDAAMIEARRRFGHRQNITGFDVGYRWNAGKRTDEICARIHVVAKVPVAELDAAEVFPAEINGVPLDIIQGPYRVSRTTMPTDHRTRSPYLMGGLSCGRVNGGTGTIGALVIDKRSGQPALLSNWHVLAGANAQVGDPVLQPGQVDSGVPVRDQVARLSRWMLETGGDAAIAEIDSRRPWLPLQFGNFIANGKARDSKLGEVLCKSGRTTGQTKARVDGEGFYRLYYEVRPGVEEMREIKGFKLVPLQAGNPDDVEVSSGGDSGSVWLNESSRDAVGLHFAGEGNPDPAAEHSIACNITTVLDKLNVRLATFEDLFEAMESSEALRDDGSHAKRVDLQRSGAELSYPDFPDFPLPFPYPWPGTGGPWPWPWPWPFDPRDVQLRPNEWLRGATPAAVDGFANTRIPDQSPSPDVLARSHRRQVQLERSFGIISDIWPRLQEALRSDRDFDGAEIGDKLRTFIPMGNAAAVIARIINRSSAFEDIRLPTVFETDFDGAVDFAHICEDIIRVLNSKRS